MYESLSIVMIVILKYREADSQLSSDADLEDFDGRNAKTEKAMVCVFLFCLFFELFKNLRLLLKCNNENLLFPAGRQEREEDGGRQI